MAHRKHKFPSEPIIGIIVLTSLIGIFLLFLPQINKWWLRDVSTALQDGASPESHTKPETLGITREDQTEPFNNINRPDTNKDETPFLQSNDQSGKIIIVIDDVGNNIEELQRFIEFPEPITFAVLPQLENSSASVELILSKGHEVILHQPMTAIGGEDPGPGAINLNLSKTEVWNLLDSNFSSTLNPPGLNPVE